MKFIATFYSHFGAVDFKKKCAALAIPARAMPVPRSLSSSCGTCISYEAEEYFPLSGSPADLEELEQIVSVTDSGYDTLYTISGG